MNRPMVGYVVTFLAVAGLAISGSWLNRPAQANEPQTDSLKTATVWQGTCEQVSPKSSYPMVLFIKERAGNAFGAVAWYPTLGDGLIELTGTVGPQGAVTFTEQKVIHGDVTPGQQRVVAGSKYTATLGRATLYGTGEWSNPKSLEKDTLRFSLSLAE